ncbi:MAG TPA: hypothetical protein VK745_18680 [Polyangiaceae bacterium]|nr:hypothetical protein [Polyangiaceae bacterium]
MSPLFGPILAQLVTMGIADRTEARYIDSDGRYAEAATMPRVGLNFGWQHASLTLGYGPSITVTPLDSTPRDVLVFHAGALAASYRFQRTTVSVAESIGYGQVSFQDQALAPAVGTATTTTTGQTPPGGAVQTPPGGTMPGGTGTTGTGVMTPAGGTLAANQVRALNQVVTFITSATTLSVANAVSAVLTVSGDIGYIETGSIGPQRDPVDYPLIRGPRAQVSARYRIAPHDDLSTTVSTQFANASTGDRSWYLVANESYAHAIDRETKTNVGTGLSISRNALADGLISYSIYPTFNAGISNVSRLWRGTFMLQTTVTAAPVIDPVRAVVDPQLGVSGTTGWGKDKFSSVLAAGTALSLLDPSSTGALSSATGSFTLGYRLDPSWSVNTGVRGAWQNYEGQTTIPWSYALFLGVSFGAVLPLNGGI